MNDWGGYDSEMTRSAGPLTVQNLIDAASFDEEVHIVYDMKLNLIFIDARSTSTSTTAS